ncbi:MAG: 50S ribosomal protein L6 [Candidatus Cloacimonetes bacterium]|jgi:large subunit ribosomal protein L6|nr:50S ribosomal protein L6 [Candidatus Cloacimonadota bacterium]
MSRIGKTPVPVPEGIKVEIKNTTITVSSKNGELTYTFQDGITIKQEENKLIVERRDDSKNQKSFHGLTRSLVNNMIIGLSEGYIKELQIIGTGYSAEVLGPWLKLNVGFSHDILMQIPENLKVEAELVPRREQGALGVQANIKISGIQKEDVGKFAAEIRKCRPPLNYATGKGIRYKGEYVRIKPGKTAATA